MGSFVGHSATCARWRSKVPCGALASLAINDTFVTVIGKEKPPNREAQGLGFVALCFL
jgi:hypothetical protein